MKIAALNSQASARAAARPPAPATCSESATASARRTPKASGESRRYSRRMARSSRHSSAVIRRMTYFMVLTLFGAVRGGVRARCPSSVACCRTSRAGRGPLRPTGRGRNGRTRNGRRAGGMLTGPGRTGRGRRGPAAEGRVRRAAGRWSTPRTGIMTNGYDLNKGQHSSPAPVMRMLREYDEQTAPAAVAQPSACRGNSRSHKARASVCPEDLDGLAVTLR